METESHSCRIEFGSEVEGMILRYFMRIEKEFGDLIPLFAGSHGKDRAFFMMLIFAFIVSDEILPRGELYQGMLRAGGLSDVDIAYQIGIRFDEYEYLQHITGTYDEAVRRAQKDICHLPDPESLP